MTDIDPELKYCPGCKEEYRAEILLCAGCQVELLSGKEFLEGNKSASLERDSRSMELSPGDELVTLRGGSLNDMKHLRTILAAERIPALLVSEDGSCGKGCCGSNFLLQVRLEDGQAALSVLADDFKRSTSLASHDLANADSVFDVEAANTTCPACGRVFETSATTCPDCGLCFG